MLLQPISTSLLLLASCAAAAVPNLRLGRDVQHRERDGSSAGGEKRAPSATGIFHTTIYSHDYGQEFTVQLSAGTPPQTMEVRVNAGSKQLLLLDSKCDVTCAGAASYDRTVSSTFKEEKDAALSKAASNVAYQETFGSDVVSVGGWNVTQLHMAIVNSSKSTPLKYGVLGLGTGNVSDDSLYSSGGSVEQLVRSNSAQWAGPQFGVYLGRNEDDQIPIEQRSAPNSRLTLGGIDSDKVSGALQWSNVVTAQDALYPAGWCVALGGVELNGTTTDLGNATVACVNSDVPYIIGPNAVLQEFYAKISNANFHPGRSLTSFPCDTMGHTLSITIDGKDWAVDAGDLIMGSADGGKTCYSLLISDTFFNTKAKGNIWYLGAPFMKNVYSAFNFTTPAALGLGTLADQWNVRNDTVTTLRPIHPGDTVSSVGITGAGSSAGSSSGSANASTTSGAAGTGANGITAGSSNGSKGSGAVGGPQSLNAAHFLFLALGVLVIL